MRAIIANIITEHYGDDVMERECAACEGMGYTAEGAPQEPCVACGGSGYTGSGRDLAEVCAEAILAALSGFPGVLAAQASLDDIFEHVVRRDAERPSPHDLKPLPPSPPEAGDR